MTINKIVIVGGGSAGWMTASTLIKFFPHIDISLIESKDFPIVGVGESTIAEMKRWLKELDIVDERFMRDCDASYKMSIKFTDFYKKDFGSFHYLFGEPYLKGSTYNIFDWHILKSLNPNLPPSDYAESQYPAYALIKKNKISDSDKFDTFNFHEHTVYHFDAVKFGQWLKNNYAIPKGVKHIIGTVGNIDINEDGINNISLEDGSIHTADLYIDCTGFKSLLIEKLGGNFISKEDILVNNRAWAAQVQYKDKYKELEPFTNCTAIDNGWCWNIPLWSRLGTGYVYSDKYVSPEDAKEEFKRYLMSDKMVVPRTKEEVDSLEFKDIQMRTGIYERTWIKNTVAIGLSAGFIEPLESNGLFTVHEFLLELVKTLKKDVTPLSRSLYNERVLEIYNNFADFISLHYALSERDDTEYWKGIKGKNLTKIMVQLEESKMHTYFMNKDDSKLKSKYNYLHYGLNCIAAGFNYKMIKRNPVILDISKVLERFEYNKARWDFAASKEVGLYEFLNNRIYK